MYPEFTSTVKVSNVENYNARNNLHNFDILEIFYFCSMEEICLTYDTVVDSEGSVDVM